MTVSINDHIQQVSDPATQRALYVLAEAIRTDLAALYANTDEIVTEAAADGIINATVLSTGSTPENVATTAFQYRIDGVTYTKAAVTAGTALGITDTINTGTAAGDYFGGFLCQINAAGTISFVAAAADQTETTAAAALVAAQAASVTAGNVAIGYFVVQANTDSAWTAGTDDLTAESDCAAVTYTPVAATTSITAASSITLTV
jgi:hypothetical protein